MGVDILQHHGARSNDGTIAHTQPLADDGTLRDEDALADFDIAGDVGAGTDGAARADPVVMTDQRAAVDDGDSESTAFEPMTAPALTMQPGAIRARREMLLKGWMSEAKR